MSDERWIEMVAMYLMGAFLVVGSVVWVQDVRRRRRDERMK